MTANLACFAARQCEPDHNGDEKLEPACPNVPSGTFSQNAQKTEIARRLGIGRTSVYRILDERQS
jgi:DNA-binding transcriptional regulator LsrR (DeoR family)